MSDWGAYNIMGDYFSIGQHKITAFWIGRKTSKGYSWSCVCGARSTVVYGNGPAAEYAGENLHMARFQSEEETRAKKEEERRRIRARSKEILDRFI